MLNHAYSARCCPLNIALRGLPAPLLVPFLALVPARGGPKLVAVGDAELSQDGRDVRLHGLLRQVQLITDLPVRVPRGDKPDEFMPPKGEPDPPE